MGLCGPDEGTTVEDIERGQISAVSAREASRTLAYTDGKKELRNTPSFIACVSCPSVPVGDWFQDLPQIPKSTDA